jgi:hypothetical protein
MGVKEIFFAEFSKRKNPMISTLKGTNLAMGKATTRNDNPVTLLLLQNTSRRFYHLRMTIMTGTSRSTKPLNNS